MERDGIYEEGEMEGDTSMGMASTSGRSWHGKVRILHASPCFQGAKGVQPWPYPYYNNDKLKPAPARAPLDA